MTREGLDKSWNISIRLIALDPAYALAWDGIAYCWYNKGFLGFDAPREAMPKARTPSAARWNWTTSGGTTHARYYPGAVRLGLGGRERELARID